MAFESVGFSVSRINRCAEAMQKWKIIPPRPCGLAQRYVSGRIEFRSAENLFRGSHSDSSSSKLYRTFTQLIKTPNKLQLTVFGVSWSYLVSNSSPAQSFPLFYQQMKYICCYQRYKNRTGKACLVSLSKTFLSHSFGNINNEYKTISPPPPLNSLNLSLFSPL